MASQAQTVKQNNDLTDSDFILTAKIYQCWDKYIHNHFVAALSTFRGQVLQAAISQTASGWVSLFSKLLIIRMLLTTPEDTKITSLYSHFFYFAFIAWANSFTGSLKMLLDMFQMLYTADPLLLFDLTQLFYVLLIHLKRQIVTCIKKKKKYRFLEKLNYSKNKLIFFPRFILLREQQVR